MAKRIGSPSQVGTFVGMAVGSSAARLSVLAESTSILPMSERTAYIGGWKGLSHPTRPPLELVTSWEVRTFSRHPRFLSSSIAAFTQQLFPAAYPRPRLVRALGPCQDAAENF